MSTNETMISTEQSTETSLPFKAVGSSVTQHLLMLTAPVLVEQLLVFLVEFFDTYLSGRFGVEATSAIGAAAYITWLACLMFCMVSVGSVALVARNWGAGKFEEANRIAGQSVLLGAVLGSLFACFAFFMAPYLCGFLQMEGKRFEIGSRYLQLDSISYPFLCLSLVGAGVIRGTGAMRITMLILGSVSIMNVIFSLTFVYGIGSWSGMGIDGIVTGTILSRFLGCMGMIGVMFSGWGTLKLNRSHLEPDLTQIRRIMNIGLPAAFEGILTWGGQFIFLRIINTISDAAFAAHVVGVQMEGISTLFAISIGQTTATMVGQSLGANRRDLAIKYCQQACKITILIAFCFNVFYFLAAEQICRVMHDSPAVQQIGTPAIKLLGFFQIPFCLLIVMMFTLRGVGATRLTLIISIIGLYLFRIPFAYFFGVYMEMGLVGAWIGMGMDVVIRCLWVSIVMIKGRWLETRI